jgi:hypothetical protein
MEKIMDHLAFHLPRRGFSRQSSLYSLVDAMVLRRLR